MTDPQPKSVADRPVVEQRDPDELRADLEERRRELGETVEELVHRVDVPSRVREKKDETVAQVKQQVAQATGQLREQAARAQDALAGKAPTVERTVREQPAGLIAVAVAVVLFALVRARRRKAHRNDEE